MAMLWILALALFAGASDAHRIVGGAPTTIDQFPGIVQVEIKNIWSETWSQACGGNILNSRSILSAAHCFEGLFYNINSRRIRAGATYRNFGGVVANVQNVFNHPTYGTNGYDGDISVIRLSENLIYSPVIQQTPIPVQDAYIADNLPVTYAGWGTTWHGGPSSEVLQYVTVYTINNLLCAERYATLPRSAPVTDNMICAGILDVGGKDACQGDSGGPLLYQDIVVGISSWGEGCANATFPGVNTAVARYTNWIVAHA